MTTSRVQGATFRYTHTIGRGEEAGTGFKNPVSVARGENDVMYVVNRAYDYRADSKRITVCTVDEDYIGEIGNGGRLGGDMMDVGEDASDGSLVWPTDIALDKDENLYITDEWLQRVAMFSRGRRLAGRLGCGRRRRRPVRQARGNYHRRRGQHLPGGHWQQPGPEVHQGRQVPDEVRRPG